MANPVLHIKDSYYFELPKVLYPVEHTKREQFPPVWVKLDPDFQDWEFDRLYDKFKQFAYERNYPLLPAKSEVKKAWHTWRDGDHANFAKPFSEFLEAKYRVGVSTASQAKAAEKPAAEKATSEATSLVGDSAYAGFVKFRGDQESGGVWPKLCSEAGDVKEYIKTTTDWPQEKYKAYNKELSGKVVIPQPFGTLRNFYEKESGFCVSKFMIIELAVALVLCVVFSWLAGKAHHGHPPKGKLWNLLETFVVFIRDQIAEPAIGHHDSHAFTPLLCTIFFFVLGCNLSGMIPWLGSPTGTFGVTLGLALVTFLTVIVSGMMRFGFLGFFKNQIPSMDLPLYIAVFIKPMILAIELLGLCIKHAVLAIRLLANMVAGHLVILGVMGLAFGAQAALSFSAPDVPSWQWPVVATIAVVGSTLFNLLELFVAFLQAYIFTFLSALFIGAAIHHH